MKHRADVLQIERPGSVQTGGRHADAASAGSARTGKASKKARRNARKVDPQRDPQPSEPQLDPQLHVVAGEEGTLAGGVVELAVPPTSALTTTIATLTSTRPSPVAALPAPTVSPIEPQAAAAVLESAVIEVHAVAQAASNPTDEERNASPLTSTGKWRTRNLFRNLTFVLLIAAAAATGLAGRYYFESTTDSRMRLLITASLVVAGLWALLTATAPQVVTLKGSMLTVKSRRGTDRFDLAEGMQQLELIGDPTSSKWALVLHRGDNTVVRLGRRDVDARTIDPLVRKFREIAERRRSEHWARMGL